MAKNTLDFDGIEYLDGTASDPQTLGWMQGTPPALDRRVKFEDDRFLGFPQIRWSLSHMRELLATVQVWRGAGGASDLGTAAPTDAAGIEGIVFEDLNGRRRTWQSGLEDTYVDGFLVLHRGRRIYERYFGALQPHLPHACFSITKSYAATLAATLLHEGVLEEGKLVSHYVPELKPSAFGDATVRQVLDMQVGVRYTELYADPDADIWKYGRAGGLRPRDSDYAGPRNYYDYLVTLKKEGAHGGNFDYKTVNTEVLTWIMKRASGVSLKDMLSERIWSRIGCEEDGYLAVDSIGVAMGGAGLSTSLRDMARFGELLRCEGAWGAQQVLPAAVIADIQRGADPAKFAAGGYPLLPGYSYRNMWWVSHNEFGAFEGRGIHGQRLYIVPKAELVIARFCSHPIATSAANDPITLPAFAALIRAVLHG